MNSIHQFELHLIQSLQLFRTRWLDSLFLFANFFDTSAFYYSFMAVAFLCGRRLGVGVFYLSMATFVANTKLKLLFALPRPSQLDPSVGLMYFDSFGFPSGAAQAAVSLIGFVAIYYRKKWISLFAILYIIFICISRVYLGVHFFTDILGGIFFGGLLLSIYIALEESVRSFLVTCFFPLKLFIALVVPICFYLIQPNYVQVPLIMLGVNIGLLCKEPMVSRGFLSKGIPFVIGALGYFICSIMFRAISEAFSVEPFVTQYEKVFLGFYFCYLVMKISSLLPCCKAE